MSWFGLFKKQRNEVMGEIQKEKINFERLPQIIEEREKEHLRKYGELRKEVKENILILEESLQEPIKLLEKVDIDKKKEHEKIKFIVKENLFLYISLLRKLITQLRGTFVDDSNDYFIKINSILKDFDSSAHLPFEKSTFLVGEEMRVTREVIGAFIRDFRKCDKINLEINEEAKKIQYILELFNELEDKKKHTKEIENDKARLDKDISECKKEVEINIMQIKKIRSGEEYLKDIKMKELNVKVIENELNSLKNRINFKLLGKCFHHDEKKNNLLKKYQSNFRFALLEDEHLEILEMVKSAQSLELGDIDKLVGKLKVVPELHGGEKEVFLFEEDLNKKEKEILSLKNEAAEELKKKEKNMIKIKELEFEIMNCSRKIFMNYEIIS